MASATPWTDFHVSPDGRVTAFNVAQCDLCQQSTMAPNAVTLKETPARLRALGMRQAVVLPPEEWHVEDLGHSACADCIAANSYR